MKKILILLIIMLFTGCTIPGTCDWSYYLPGNYSIEKANSNSIYLNQKMDDTDKIITKFNHTIKKFMYSDKYIVLNILDKETRENFIYIINILSDNVTILKDFNEEELIELTDIKIINWIKTDPIPEGAYSSIREEDDIPLFWELFFSGEFIFFLVIVPLTIIIYLVIFIKKIIFKIKNKHK